MSRHRFSLALIFVIALLAMLAAPVAAQRDEPGKLVIGGSYTLATGQQLNGDLGVIGGQAVIQEGAAVNGDVMVTGGMLTVAGRINGDIALFGGAVTLQPTAYVAGDLVSFGGSVQRSPGVVVKGETREGGEADGFSLPFSWRAPGIGGFAPERGFMQQQTPGQWLLAMLWRAVRAGVMILALAALALIVALLWPRGIQQLGATVTRQPALVMLGGLLSWVVGLGLVGVLAITFCLLPVAIALALALLVAVLLSWVVAGWLVGRSLLSMLKLQSPTVALEAVAGTLLLAIVYFLVGIIPCTEFIFGLLIASLGLGALVLTRFGTRPYPLVPAVSGETPPDERGLATIEDPPQPPQPM